MAPMVGLNHLNQLQTAHVNASGILMTNITTSGGNAIATHLSSDGDYHLGTSMEQNVVADPKNTSSDNLGIGNL